MTQRLDPFTIAATDAAFDRLFRDSTTIARLEQGSTAETEYEALDARINRQLDAVGRNLFPADFVEKHVFVSDMWLSDRTRRVEVTIDAMTQPYYDGLRAVMAAAPEGWRVQVVVYGLPADAQTMIGSAAIWADAILIDRALYGLLTWRGIDFRAGTQPVWRQ